MELCKNAPESVTQSTDGAQAMVKLIYNRDDLSTISDVYHDFMTLFTLKRGQNVMFRNFESSFEVQVSKFSTHPNLSKIPASLPAHMVLENSNVDTGQQTSVLAAAES